MLILPSGYCMKLRNIDISDMGNQTCKSFLNGFPVYRREMPYKNTGCWVSNGGQELNFGLPSDVTSQDVDLSTKHGIFQNRSARSENLGKQMETTEDEVEMVVFLTNNVVNLG